MSAMENLQDYEIRSGSPLDERVTGRTLVYLLAGIGLGAGLALLLTPKRGDEVREAIGRGYRRSITSLGEQAHNLRERAQDLGEGLRQRGSNLLQFRKRG